MPILNTLPERAKVEINRSPILLPLQGVGVCTLIPRALPWAGDWLPFQGTRSEGCGGLPLKGRVFKILIIFMSKLSQK